MVVGRVGALHHGLLLEREEEEGADAVIVRLALLGPCDDAIEGVG